jgi:acetolactate synthase-1/2/3 large subunit
MKNASEVVCDILVEAGIDHAFGMPGGSTLSVFNALYHYQDKIKTVLVRHEGGASCMADMYGRLTGKPGVLLGQGPWLGSNGGFGIMEAYMAGSPMLIIGDFSDYSGLTQHAPYQCSSGEYGAIDLTGIMRSMTKYTTVANSPSEFAHGVQLAIKHATTGRPGPACVLTRFLVPGAEFDLETANPKLFPLEGYLNISPPCISQEDAERAAALLLEAKDPVIIAGRGIHSSRAYDELKELAELIGAPVATSYMGKSSLAETHDLALGTMGIIGQPTANMKITGADALLAVGTGLSPENTKMMEPEYIRPDNQKIIHIDIEPLNAGWTYPVALGIASDAKLALSGIVKAIKGKSANIDAAQRIDDLKKLKDENNFFSSDSYSSDETPISPERIVNDLNESLGPDDLLVLDAGNNRMWCSRHFKSKSAGQVVAPGGAAGVGWGPPASLAAQLVLKDRNIVCVTGDGGMRMHQYTMEMANEHELPITCVVFNNSCLGNVMDFQPKDQRLAVEFPETDFAAVARDMGCKGLRIEDPKELKPALKAAIESDRPALLDVVTSQERHFKLRK